MKTKNPKLQIKKDVVKQIDLNMVRGILDKIEKRVIEENFGLHVKI